MNESSIAEGIERIVANYDVRGSVVRVGGALLFVMFVCLAWALNIAAVAPTLSPNLCQPWCDPDESNVWSAGFTTIPNTLMLVAAIVVYVRGLVRMRASSEEALPIHMLIAVVLVAVRAIWGAILLFGP